MTNHEADSVDFSAEIEAAVDGVVPRSEQVNKARRLAIGAQERNRPGYSKQVNEMVRTRRSPSGRRNSGHR